MAVENKPNIPNNYTTLAYKNSIKSPKPQRAPALTDAQRLGELAEASDSDSLSSVREPHLETSVQRKPVASGGALPGLPAQVSGVGTTTSSDDARSMVSLRSPSPAVSETSDAAPQGEKAAESMRAALQDWQDTSK